MKNKLIKITKTILLIIMIVLIVWDVVIISLKAFDATISFQMMTISSKFIAFPLFWGILGSHFFCSKIGRRLFGKIPKLRYLIWIPQAVAVLVLSIVGCFKNIPQLVWLGDNLYVPFVCGLLLGTMWWQENKNSLKKFEKRIKPNFTKYKQQYLGEPYNGDEGKNVY